ncbi:MAG: response regulator transcription factor [Chloroflexota bacterium]|nr:response regulator transcription factor [Chloroflexota bacterium]
MTTPIHVLIADDHEIVRRGIRALLATEPGIDVVAEAPTGSEAVIATARHKPDVILMDLMMPGMDGIEATRQIKANQPTAHILVLTSFATDDKIFPAIKAGALGYLLKDAGPEELVQAIRLVHRGESSLHPAVARQVLQELSRTRAEPPSPDPLSERELMVLQALARGLGNQEIAHQLSIGEATVRTHVSNILSKLHLASRTQAAIYAIRKGIAPLE